MCEARNFTACVDEICCAGCEIYSVGLEGGFRATRQRKICSVKYGAEFCGAAHGDKIYGAMADDKIFDIVSSAGAGNFELQNECANLKPLNTYVDLKFKGGANSEPAGDANFKFKNGASFGFLCGGNARSLKSRNFMNALSFSDVAEISALIRAGEILKYGVTVGISAFALASKILIPSIAGKILNLSAAPRADVEFKVASGC